MRARAPRPRPFAPALVAFAFVLLAAPARADRWYEHYARAEKALAASDWRTAVAELNGAIEAKGDSGVRERTYGMRVVDYFPYLRLGIAYFHLGEIDAADARLGELPRDQQRRVAGTGSEVQGPLGGWADVEQGGG